MKKIAAIVLAFLLLFALTACKTNGDDANPGDLSSGGDSSSDGLGEEGGQSAPLVGDYSIAQGMRYDLPDNDVDRFVRFVRPFNVLPTAFDSPSELSDETMLFTAAAASEADFTPTVDEYSSAIELAKIEKKVSDYFGNGASLSADYKTKDYFPYVIEGEKLVRHAGGSIGQYFFPYALIRVEDGYLLYLVDLMDPLFYDIEENRDKLHREEEIIYEDIKDIVLDMQFNIYHVTENDSGRLQLKEFRFENQKSINHYMF